MRLWLAGGAVALLLSTVAYVGWLRMANERLREEMEVLEREFRTQQVRLEQAQTAQAVLVGHLSRAEAKGKEYDRLRATLEGVDDAPLPDWFRDYLARLLQPEDRDKAGAARGPRATASTLSPR